jgi:hypothetical protein
VSIQLRASWSPIGTALFRLEVLNEKRLVFALLLIAKREGNRTTVRARLKA